LVIKLVSDDLGSFHPGAAYNIRLSGVKWLIRLLRNTCMSIETFRSPDKENACLYYVPLDA